MNTQATTQATKDTEYTLTSGRQSAVVSPFGASLRRYFVKTDAGEWNAIWGYSGGANKQGGQGDVLIPFPGRIKNGTYEFEGQRHQLVKNDKDGPNAIHGFLRAEIYNTELVAPTQVVFTYEIAPTIYAEKGFPFSLHVEVAYSLGDQGLKTTYKITNIGKTDAPAAAGFHPYFRAEIGHLADWNVTIPAKDYIELENIVPTGRVCAVEGTTLDFRKGRVIGNERYNDCLAHLERGTDGTARVTVQARGSKNRVTLHIDHTFDYVVIYTGDQVPAPNQRQGFAIEPMTCAPDAFNHEGWGTQVLKPGGSMTGSYSILAELASN